MMSLGMFVRIYLLALKRRGNLATKRRMRSIGLSLQLALEDIMELTARRLASHEYFLCLACDP